MTELRKEMIKAMELRNFSKHTQRTYLSAVSGLAKYYMKSPDKISKEMIEDYLLHLTKIDSDPIYGPIYPIYPIYAWPLFTPGHGCSFSCTCP